MAKPIDVRKTIATVIADMRASGDTGMVENLLEADAAIGELIEMMGEVLQLWDTERMSIDAKAAALQDRPEKWRAAPARGSGGAT